MPCAHGCAATLGPLSGTDEDKRVSEGAAAPAPADDDPDGIVPFDSGLSSEVFLDGPDRVLKLYRAPFEPAAIENEFFATGLARRLGFPVAKPFAIVERDGRRGILFERLHGRTMMRHHAKNPLGLMLALRRLAITQARLHAHAAEGLPSQHERLRAEIGWARVPEATRTAALAALDTLPSGTRLCHGDIHPNNVLCTPDGLRIIDWQKACAGNPAADVARAQVMIRHGRLGRGRLAEHSAVQGLRGLAAFWYGLCYQAETRMPSAEIAAWHLPLMVARLCGRWTDKDDEILAVVDRLMKRRAAPGEPA